MFRNNPAIGSTRTLAALQPARDGRLEITAVAAPTNENADPDAPIARRERLGGILNFYYRRAA
jgi:hypothetical protein